MESMRGKLILITGASSGIGEACARLFAENGARLLLLARREQRLRELALTLQTQHGAEVMTCALDVRRRADVETTLAGLPAEWREIDILINNAGLARGLGPIHAGDPDDWDEMIDTNVKGLLYVTRMVTAGMVARRRGHVINIGSIAGRDVYPGGNVYCASKFAVTALTRGLSIDLLGSGVRVSTVDPGMVETEFSEVRFRGDHERARRVYEGLEPLTGADVAEAVLFCATRPRHATVRELVLTPTAQASVVHVFRATS